MNVLCIVISSQPNTFHFHFLLAYIHHTVNNLKAVNIATSSATITWDQPPHIYRVFLHGEATDNIPLSKIKFRNVTGNTTHIVEGLYSFRNYSIGVYLESDLGQGNNATVTFHTLGRGENVQGTMSLKWARQWSTMKACSIRSAVQYT